MRPIRVGLFLLVASMASATAQTVDPGVCQDGTPNAVSKCPASSTFGSKLDLSGYTLSFDDEFNAPDVSDKDEGVDKGAKWYWSPFVPGTTRFLPQYPGVTFLGPGPDSPIKIENGILSLTARERNGKWESGEIRSVDSNGRGFAQTYGYFEIRAKLPPGRATWPGFWLLMKASLLDGSRARGEVDILEAYGEKPNNVLTSVHIRQLPAIPHWKTSRYAPVPGQSTSFHRYGAMLTPGWITFYLDGREVYRVANTKILQGPWYILVTMGMQNGWKLLRATSPSEMEVDYVRVYAPPSGPSK